MLVLSRMKGEAVIFTVPASPNPTTLKVEVVELRFGAKHKVRLGIDAPIEVVVNRAEVQQRMDAEVAGRDESGVEA